jgi:hypothetical protein
MIDSACLDQVCSEVDSYSDDRMLTEFNGFFREQPSLCEFITQLTSDSDAAIQELSLFLSYMVFKAVKRHQSEDILEVPQESIEAAYRECEEWIEKLSEEGNAARLPADSEPYLVQYVISELNHPLDNGAMLDEEEKGEVFFVLKTVISSLTRSPLGKEN